MQHNVKKHLIKGTDEISLVYSGLEDTMTEAFQEIATRYLSNEKVKDLRTAAFMLAIEKIDAAYGRLGVFP